MKWSVVPPPPWLLHRRGISPLGLPTACSTAAACWSLAQMQTQAQYQAMAAMAGNLPRNPQPHPWAAQQSTAPRAPSRRRRGRGRRAVLMMTCWRLTAWSAACRCSGATRPVPCCRPAAPRCAQTCSCCGRCSSLRSAEVRSDLQLLAAAGSRAGAGGGGGRGRRAPAALLPGAPRGRGEGLPHDGRHDLDRLRLLGGCCRGCCCERGICERGGEGKEGGSRNRERGPRRQSTLLLAAVGTRAPNHTGALGG